MEGRASESESNLKARTFCHERYNPKIMFSMKFWSAYMAMRPQFKIGEYVLFHNGTFVSKSDAPFPINYSSDVEPNYDIMEYVHQVADNDEDFYQYALRFPRDKPLEPDAEQKHLLDTLLAQLEQNGNYFSITITQAFTGDKYVVGDFDQRKYVIYGTDADYKILNGEYENRAQIKQKIKEAKALSIGSKTGMSDHDTPFDNLYMDTTHGTLYLSGGGSVSSCRTVGFIKFT